MKKMIVPLAASTACILLTASGTEMPDSGLFEMKSGDYTVTLLPKRACSLSGFAYDGIQLFTSDTASAGSVVQPLRTPEKVLSVELEADGAKISRAVSPVSGKKLVFTKTSLLDGLRLKTVMTLTPSGLIYSVSYEIVSGEKPSYFYPVTMPWNTAFTDWIMNTPSGGASGNLVSDGSWCLNADLSSYALYRQNGEVGVAAGVKTPIPTAVRKHAIWDHKTYHKYFLFHKLPEWKKGYRSPVYTMEFRAFRSNVPAWRKTALETIREMGLAPSESNVRMKNNVTIVEAGPVSGRRDWNNPRRGIEALDPDYVLPPFRPVEAKGDTASVWNREYRISPYGLIAEAGIAGGNFLAEPMTFRTVVNGRETVYRTGAPRLVESRKGRAVFAGRADSDLLSLEVRTTVEYDGMVRVDLAVEPKREVVVNRLEYAFSLPEKNALYMHFIGCPNVNGLSIMVPSESMSFKVPERDGIFFREPFKTLVWFGDNDKGFLWFSGSEKNFYPDEQADRPGALEAVKKGGKVTFTVSPVTKPLKTSRRLDYTFGFFATPVRPMGSRWRNWLFTTRRGMYGSEKSHGVCGSMPMVWPDEYRSTAAPLFSRESEAEMKRFTEELHKKGRPALGYFDPIRVHIGYLKYLDRQPKGQQLNDLFLARPAGEDAFLYRVPILQENMKAWQTIPELIYAYGASKGGREVRVSSDSGWADFACFLMECYAKLGFDGMGDIDNCFPIRDMNPLHGAGYVGFDGKRRCEWDWFARRDLMKRFAAVFLKERGRAILVAHASATWSIPFMSFCDANMTFEHSNSGYVASERYLSEYASHNRELREKLAKGDPAFLRYAFPPERWRAELTGRQFGIPCVIMSNLTKSPQLDKKSAEGLAAARELTGRIAAHDCIMWPIWCDTAPMITLQKIRDAFGTAEPDVEFHPYWSQKKVRAEGFAAGYYKRPGKALVIIVNFADRPVSGTVDFSALKPAGIRNAETGKSFRDGGVLSLAAGDYAIFETAEK